MSRTTKAKLTKLKKQKLLSKGSSSITTPTFTKPEVFNITEREIIQPKLDYFSKGDLRRNVRGYVNKRVQELGLDEGKTMEKFDKLPPYVLYDMYNLHKVEQSEMKIAKIDSKNKWQMNMVNRFNNPYLRIVTQNHNFYSFLATAEMTTRLVQVLADTSEEGLQKQFGQGGDGLPQPSDAALDKAIKEGQKEVDDKIQKSEEMGGLLPGDESGEHDLNKQLDYIKLLSEIYIKDDKVTNFITKTLKCSTAYFSKKYKEIEESLFEADDYDEIINLEELAFPDGINPLAALDLVVPRREYHMKFDVYVDYSGSMDSSYHFNSKKHGSTTITGYDLSALTALRINKAGFINDCYVFDNSVKKLKQGALDYLHHKPGGGTTTDKVIQNIAKTGNPGLIITDGADTLRHYSPNAFIILVLGGDMCRNEIGDKFVNNKQVMKFDPNTNVFEFYKR